MWMWFRNPTVNIGLIVCVEMSEGVGQHCDTQSALKTQPHCGSSWLNLYRNQQPGV